MGEFHLTDGSLFDLKLLANNGCVVGRALLDEMHVQVGDKLKFGEGVFEIRATFDEEPGGGMDFDWARGFLSRRMRSIRRILRGTQAAFGEEFFTALPTIRRNWSKICEPRSQGTSVQVNSYREQQENLNQNFERTENYLSLTGLLILVLGGVGVWNVLGPLSSKSEKRSQFSSVSARAARVLLRFTCCNPHAWTFRQCVWRHADAGWFMARAMAVCR